jgi:hypothetical protein
MQQQKLESKLVRLIMPDAPDDEIADATRVWFAYLHLVSEIVAEKTSAACDSCSQTRYATLSGDSHPNI